MILFFFIPFADLSAQNVPNILKNSPLLNNLRNLRRNASDTALAYANNIIEIARNNNDKHLECEAYLEVGRIYFAKDNQIKALEQILYAESISTPNDNCYYTAPQVIGFILNRQGKAEEALKYLFTALKRADSANYANMTIGANFSIADAYRENKNSARALGYALNGLKKAEILKDTAQIIYAYSTLSNILSNRDYFNKERLDSAVQYHEKIMKPPFSNKGFSPYDSAKNFSNMGRLYRMQQKFDLAQKNLDVALDVANRRNFKSYQQSILNEIATLELDKGNNEKALALTKQAKDILPASQTSLNRVKELAERTQEADAATGNYEAAFADLMKANKIKDSLFSLKNQAAIAEIEKRYERDTILLKATNMAIKKESERKTIIFVAIFIITFSTMFFIWRLYKRNKQNEFLSTLIHEVNHRTKNNLQMLNSLITSIYHNVADIDTKAEILKLRSYIKSFGLVYDNLNKTGSFDNVDISAYTKDIGSAVINNAIDGNLEFKYSADSEILVATDKAILIGVIINELVTNSLKHAFASCNHKQIAISIVKKGNVVNITYQDNGAGQISSTASATSFGMSMIQQLVKQLKGILVIDTNNMKRITISVPIN
jgi:two-component sensor histidine kinase